MSHSRYQGKAAYKSSPLRTRQRHIWRLDQEQWCTFGDPTGQRWGDMRTRRRRAMPRCQWRESHSEPIDNLALSVRNDSNEEESQRRPAEDRSNTKMVCPMAEHTIVLVTDFIPTTGPIIARTSSIFRHAPPPVPSHPTFPTLRDDCIEKATINSRLLAL